MSWLNSVNKNFFAKSYPTDGGGGPRSRWLIMEVDHIINYWAAVSRDYAFSQAAAVSASTLASLESDIAKYIASHSMLANQPLYVDANGEPWVIAGGAVAMTPAYDGVYINYPGSITDDGSKKSVLTAEINKYVAEKYPGTPLDPPADLKDTGYSKADAPPPPFGPLPPGSGPTDPTKPPVPVTPPPPPPAAAQASSGVSPLLLAGIAAAGVYWFTQRNNPRGGSPRGSR